MKDAFGVERISKGVPLGDIPFALKMVRANKQMPSGEKGFMSAKLLYTPQAPPAPKRQGPPRKHPKKVRRPGSEKIKKGVPIKGQLTLFPLKGMTRAKRISSFEYGHSGSYNTWRNRQAKQIPGQTYLNSQKANGGREFKIVSLKPPKTNDDIALSPEGQQKLANKLKELDRKHAGRFASSGPKVSRNDHSDSSGSHNRAVGTRKSVSVIRLSERERVGKSEAFGVEITKGVPKFPDWMHARAIAKPDSPLTHAMKKLQAGHVNPKPEIKQFRPESGIHNGDKIITTGEHSPGRYFIRNTRTGNNSTARAEDINFKINRKKPKRPKPPTQGTLF